MRAILRTVVRTSRKLLPEPVKGLLRPVAGRIRQYRLRRLTAAPSFNANTRRRYAAEPRHVVFVSEVPRGREAKIAHGLRSKGWRVSLLHKTLPNYDLGRYFDSCVRYSEADDVVDQALRFKPVAYHLFSLAGDASATRMVNAGIGPTVFDTTDLLESTYRSEALKERARPQIEMQRHGLRYADGYCARDLQFKYAQRLLGYRLGGRPIFLPEYCWGTAHPAAERAKAGDARTVRCVLAGNFGIEKLGQGDWGYLGIARKFIAARTALHLYPNWMHSGSSDRQFGDVFADYLELARTSEYFELHRPLRVDELSQRLSEYDFGVNIVWAEVAGLPFVTFNPAFFPYCMSARVFDYLDAGLPVLLSRSHRLVHAMLARYGAGIPVDGEFMENIEAALRSLATVEMRNRAVAASRGLAIERHVGRLAAFYERVAADVGISVST